MTSDAIVAGLPLDALVLLVGPAGSGKSTWATNHYRAEQILSSDTYRLWVAGDAADQAATADAFKVLHIIAKARLRRGLPTVIDATNLTQRARRSLLRLAAAMGRPAVAIVFDLSLERCLAQNRARPDRLVPDDVVRRHHAELQRALEQLPTEGYAEVHLLQDADIASV